MTKYAGFAGFLKQNTTGSTYVTVPQVLTVSAVGSDRGLIDVSAHGDTWADYIVGRQDGAEVEITFLWDPANTVHQTIKTDYDAVTPTARSYELQHPSWTTAYRFPTIPSHWDVEATDDGGMEAHVTLKIITPGVSTVTPS